MDFRPLWVSVKISILATIIVFILGLVAARLVYKTHGAARYIADVLFSLPLVLPPTVVGFYLLVCFGKNSPVGQFMAKLDISFIFTWQAALLAAAVVAFPLMYRAAISAFEQVDNTLISAARTLGMGEAKIFFRLLLPLSWQGIVGGIVLSFARALGEFGATMMIAGNIPGRTQTMPLAIYFAMAGGDMRAATVWVIIITAVSCAMLAIINGYSAKRAKRGAGA
ncbi:MAG: molybdate ABC transporter permease subunit [Oscillospiraceae bacterium]